MIYLFTAIVFPPGDSVWVNWYRNRKERAIYRRINSTQIDTNQRMYKIENKITKKTTINKILKHTSRVILK